jgi:hypothetical protein
MLDINQFRESIVKSTLNDLLLYSPEVEELLVFTCATESLGGTYIRQQHGPALGIYQMEPETYTDIWANYLHNQNNLRMILITNFDVSRIPSPERMIYDMRFSTAMARIFYTRFKEPLPKIDDVDNIWWYYKKFWNTDKGAATKEHSIKLYEGFKGAAG